jgi:hypothetical protein
LRHPLRAASLRDQIPLHRVMARSLMCGVRDPVAAGDINTDPAISGTVRQHHGEVAFIGSLLVRRRLLSVPFFGQTGPERRSSWRAPRANLLRLRSHRASCALGAVIPLQHWSCERGEPSGLESNLGRLDATARRMDLPQSAQAPNAYLTGRPMDG